LRNSRSEEFNVRMCFPFRLIRIDEMRRYPSIPVETLRYPSKQVDHGTRTVPDLPAVVDPAGPGGPLSRPYARRVARTGDDRIVTIPNAFSLVRLACVPLFLWLLFGRHHRAAAASLLAVLGCTDWVDGWIARRFDQGSTLGKVLDPTADRLLLAAGVLGILIDRSVPRPLGVFVVAREILVSVVVVVLAALGAKRFDVQWAGKAGTMGYMLAFPLFLAHKSTFSWRAVAGVFAWICVIPAIAFSVYATVTYVPLARKALAEGRAGRSA
jgi:cardiolipin synthase (CMP-forming)